MKYKEILLLTFINHVNEIYYNDASYIPQPQLPCNLKELLVPINQVALDIWHVKESVLDCSSHGCGYRNNTRNKQHRALAKAVSKLYMQVTGINSQKAFRTKFLSWNKDFWWTIIFPVSHYIPNAPLFFSFFFLQSKVLLFWYSIYKTKYNLHDIDECGNHKLKKEKTQTCIAWNKLLAIKKYKKYSKLGTVGFNIITAHK